MNPKSRKSVRSLKSWLFTPGTKADHFEKAAEVRGDALIIDLEGAVAPSAKQQARCAALHYLEGLGSGKGTHARLVFWRRNEVRSVVSCAWTTHCVRCFDRQREVALRCRETASGWRHDDRRRSDFHR